MTDWRKVEEEERALTFKQTCPNCSEEYWLHDGHDCRLGNIMEELKTIKTLLEEIRSRL